MTLKTRPRDIVSLNLELSWANYKPVRKGTLTIHLKVASIKGPTWINLMFNTKNRASWYHNKN